MMRFASSRAPASCVRYSSWSFSASPRVASAFSISPWICSLLCSRTSLNFGSTHFHVKKNRTAKASSPTMSSPTAG